MNKLLKCILLLSGLLGVMPAHAVSLVQSKAAAIGATSGSASFTSLPATADSVIVEFDTNGGSDTVTVADNQAGNAYSLVVSGYNTAINKHVYLYWVQSVAAASGTFTVTVTDTAGFSIGDINIVEASGITAVDKSIGTTADQSAGTSFTLSASAANAGPVDLVIASIQTSYNSHTAIGLTTPSGYTSLDLNDPGTGGYSVSTCYKIESGTPTDSAKWTWTTNTIAPTAAILVSFKGGTPVNHPNQGFFM